MITAGAPTDDRPALLLLTTSAIPGLSGTGSSDAGQEPSEPTLVQLMLLVCEGDEKAFEQLYHRTSPRVYGVALRVLRSADLAAEVAQEVYVEVWQQSARYDASRGGVLAWMTTMAHRRAVDRVRSVSTATARDERWGRAAAVGEHDEVWERASARLADRRVTQALQRLTPRQREAVVGLYFDGLTAAQLAERIGVPVGTVKTRLRDGLLRLKGELVAA